PMLTNPKDTLPFQIARMGEPPGVDGHSTS
ncbi:MAG: hypothetical protein QOG22_414, partial [Pseudonocardiales bacterium]|nr:hypothetical protein [Pseudonocardiales bacterium]